MVLWKCVAERRPDYSSYDRTAGWFFEITNSGSQMFFIGCP
jgi:hypothetical protein